MNRKQIAIKSSTINLISQLCSMLITFISRKLFIQYIGIELLGLNSVLTDMLGLLALSELGVGAAITFRLYKPTAHEEHEKINTIVSLYKYIYRIIACVILVLGIVLSFFLKYFISNIEVEMSVIYIAYFLMLLSSVVTYLLSYKRTLLYTDQKQYINVSIDAVSNIVFSILNLLLLYFFSNYYLYIIITLIQKLISNLWASLYCDKIYPWLRTDLPFNKELAKDLFHDTKDIVFGRISGYVFTASDTLIISGLISTATVGLLGNYKVITGAISRVITGLLEPIQPLIGNYIANESVADAEKLFHRYGFIRYAFCVVLLIPAMCLAHLCIDIWLGSSYQLSNAVVYLLIANLYISFVQGPSGEYINVLGYFKYDKYVYLIGAVFNIVVSIAATTIWGIEGVLLGTIASQIIMWIGRSFVVYKRYFGDIHTRYIKYWLKQLCYLLLFILYYLISLYCIQLVNIPSAIITFIIQGIICVMVSGLLLCLTFFRHDDFKYTVSFLHSTIGAKLHRN